VFSKNGSRREGIQGVFFVWGDVKGTPTCANFLIAVKPLDCAVLDFTTPRIACEVMIAVVITLDANKDQRF
jgi:hypothetical protein